MRALSHRTRARERCAPARAARREGIHVHKKNANNKGGGHRAWEDQAHASFEPAAEPPREACVARGVRYHTHTRAADFSNKRSEGARALLTQRSPTTQAEGRTPSQPQSLQTPNWKPAQRPQAANIHANAKAPPLPPRPPASSSKTFETELRNPLFARAAQHVKPNRGAPPRRRHGCNFNIYNCREIARQSATRLYSHSTEQLAPGETCWQTTLPCRH